MDQLVLVCACAALVLPALAADMPKPLLELHFSNDLVNSGSLGGEGKLVECAPGEGGVFAPGLRGMGMSFAASSRGGGSDRTQAGGAIRLDGKGIVGLEQMTLAVWFKPVGHNAPARLFFLNPSWDLFVSGPQIGFKVKHNKTDYFRCTPRKDVAAADRAWNFIAVTLDRGKRVAHYYHALRDGEVRLAETWTDVPPYDIADAELEIGNLAGIRPFKGIIDCARIFDVALSQEQVAAVCASDLRRQTLKDYARNVPPRKPLFDYGDVCLSSRSERRDSIETIKAFRANRLVWCYTHKPDFVRRCREAGCKTFQGTINSIPGWSLGRADAEQARVLDLDGKPVVAPWMVAFNRKNPWYWGCANRPAFMEISLARVKKALDAGADWIQFDDWSLTVSAAGWSSSCFCHECMRGFRQYLKKRLSADEIAKLGIEDTGAFDYKRYLAGRCGITDAATYSKRRRSLPTTQHFEDFQRHAVRAFFIELRRRINELAGRDVPLSINTTLCHPSQRQNFLSDVVDYFQGEQWDFDLAALSLGAKVAEGLGKWQLFVPKPRDLRLARMGVAAGYALGQFILVPWDMYMGSDATGIRPRYYGTVEQYGGLFHFVRDHERLFNGYETAAAVGLVVDLDHYDRARVASACQRLLDAQAPFAILPVGHEFYDSGLDAQRLRGFKMLLTTCPLDALAATDRAAITSAAADVPVMLDMEAADGDLAAASPFHVYGPRGVYIMPRAKRDPDDRTLVCHVLNRVDMRGRDVLKWVSFLVRRDALPSGKLAAVRWHVPGRDAAELEWEELADGVRVIIPELPIWGIAELRFE